MIERKKMLIYVAGPLSGDGSAEDIEANIRAAIRRGSLLIRAGYNVVIPHLTMFIQRFWEEDPDEWEDLLAWGRLEWLDYDFAQLEKCDAMYLIPGASPGADWELAFCKGRGIPVAKSMGDLKYIRTQWEKSYV